MRNALCGQEPQKGVFASLNNNHRRVLAVLKHRVFFMLKNTLGLSKRHNFLKKLKVFFIMKNTLS